MCKNVLSYTFYFIKMSEKLRDYQVLDVVCGGTLYKVKHKVTNNIYTWKAFDCSKYSTEQIENITSDVKTISKLEFQNLLQYYDTILHTPSKTLYLVLEHNTWSSIQELIIICRNHDKIVTESFVWYLIYELSRLCKDICEHQLKIFKKCVSPSSVFIEDSGALRVDLFEFSANVTTPADVMRQVGEVIHAVCHVTTLEHTTTVFHYSDDLQSVVTLLTEDRSTPLPPDAILYHPTVLSNLEFTVGSKRLSDILVSSTSISAVNKCDSQKAVESCSVLETSLFSPAGSDSPAYANVSCKVSATDGRPQSLPRLSSPTIAALALELPGYVPRCRRPLPKTFTAPLSPQRVSQETLSQQWMSRMMELRQRELSLDKRERDLVSKEETNSPVKAITANDQECKGGSDTNGITLPHVIPAVSQEVHGRWVTRRRRSSSVRIRKQRRSYAYENLDSSLSADNGDGSVIVTAAKFTKDNMPRRNIFPEVCNKKVHFTSANPFAESNESLTLTFYELENIDIDGYQVPNHKTNGKNDITKFKYLDLEKVTSEKRSAMQQWNSSSPSKQAKKSNTAFTDITNQGNIRKTPSKSSLASKTSNSSNSTRYTSASSKSAWSMESGKSKTSENHVSERTRSSMRCSLAPVIHKPEVDIKKPKSRKSLLHFKAPFKFMTSTKI